MIARMEEPAGANGALASRHEGATNTLLSSDSSTAELADVAADYAEGFSGAVLPLISGAKIPYTGLTRDRAERRRARIRQLFLQYPEDEIGMIIPNHLAVIDIDDSGTFRGQRLGVPPTATASTSRGVHHYVEAARRLQTRKQFRPGIDVLGAGHLVFLPPAPHRGWLIHPDEGLAPAPDWLGE